MQRTYSGTGAKTVCGGIVTGASNPTTPRYCGAVSAASAAHGYLDVGLQGTLDATAAKDSTFTFATTQEVDLALYRNGQLIWRWSASRHFAPSAHSLTIQPGASYDWTTSWRATDRNGNTLPAGDYQLVGTILARELGSSNSWTTTVTV